ncbi:TasA family protein [Carnobacterium sp.]|uniref:TasA family protein n=1 Tax=Carnobacterium sp. TaxID=48221 RepID=UPI00388FD673
MKKAQASRLKKLPLLLGTLLIISVAAYGTRAYFSDSAKQQGNIELSLGTVDISTDNTTMWEYKPLTTGDNLDVTKAKNDKLVEVKQEDNVKYTNVRPGDSFVRTYSIKNTGSLDVKVNLSSANIPVQLSTVEKNGEFTDGPFKITIKGLEENFLLAPDVEKTYTVAITVDPLIGNEFNATALDQAKFTKDYLKEAITVKAVQTNSKDFARAN